MPVSMAHSSQPGHADLSLWQAQYRDLLVFAPDKRALQRVVGEPRLVYTPGLPASLAMVLRGEFLHAAACGGQKATSTIAVLRVTPSGDMQGKPLNSKGWSRAG